MISIIVAVAENNAIGRENGLLLHLSDDLKRFKRLTSGHPVIMGRKTFESLPNGALPNRRNIVLTSRPETLPETVIPVSGLDEALQMVAEDEEAFIIGGGKVYAQALSLADKLYLTHIHRAFDDADTFFPEIDKDQWQLVEKEEHPADEKHAVAFTFADYIKK